MNPSKLLSLSIAALCTVVVSAANAQTTATSNPAGFVTIPCPANSDTRIAPPLTRPPEFTGAVTTPLPGAGSTITVAGSPGWVSGQFVFAPPTQPKTYYAIFGPAASAYAAEGKFFTVTGNGANTLTLDLGGDDISSVPANAQVQLIPYWTLATLFPPADLGISYINTTVPATPQTSILIPNHGAPGTNTPPATTYFYFNSAWRKVGQPLTSDFGNDTIAPADNFIVRNRATATNLVNLGGVEMKKVTTPLVTLAGGANTRQDNFVAIVRPVDVRIRDLGLVTSGAFTATTIPATLQDQILVFDNTAVGTNKPPTATYFYFNNAFRKVGSPLTDDKGDDVIPAGTGFVIRKAGTPAGATAFWTNDKTYNP